MIRSAATPLARTLALSARSSCASRYALSTTIIASRRTLTTTTTSQNSLASKRVDENASKGAEGLHYADATAVKEHDQQHRSDVQVTGDWVLFHPVYSKEELKSVLPTVHRNEEKLSDKFANGLVRFFRKAFDVVSGYKHKDMPEKTNLSVKELREQGYIMTETGWMNRCLFLETIAGIPGMAAATIRHLHSLRLLRRDAGWIHTLLEEAENERMHLMSFLAIRKPGIFMRGLILGAQGVFYNVFFFSYLMAPRVCHRFVGYLEEEAVKTYTALIADLENGRFPEWENKPAPPIAKDYWRLRDNATLLDMIYAIRSDEVTHRFVNHSLANLKKGDVNPFAYREPDMTVKGVKYGFERDEAEKYVQESQKLLAEEKSQPSA
ncbi:alternative oxidase [Fomitiporia mediterranea MF3/22]|uniref:alternative oxidase n=1 Tax=Fomitiporia mediterranea (strain MF3/22) TaxID=694068 RepID=UPI0004408C42|nr:alternative oxidase [Fomitiporia mediterranea MF3/22]EJC98005.1 alternative oxidase [Fomitiporia mediterranea MF3/22]